MGSVCAYYQIPISEKKIAKTTFITPFGQFEFPRMTFGYGNASQLFQWFTNLVVHGSDFCDDVLITSDNVEHQYHLKFVFERFQKFGVVINLAKYVFSKFSF